MNRNEKLSNSAVGIASRYGLDGLGFKSRWRPEVFCFPETVHMVPGAYLVDTVDSPLHPPPGVKRPGRDIDHSPPSSAEIKNEWSFTSASPVGLHDMYIDILFFIKAWLLSELPSKAWPPKLV